MELIIENIKSATDKKLITDLATRLGLKVHAYDAKKEDAALVKAMKKAEKGKILSKKDALKYLNDNRWLTFTCYIKNVAKNKPKIQMHSFPYLHLW